MQGILTSVRGEVRYPYAVLLCLALFLLLVWMDVGKYDRLRRSSPLLKLPGTVSSMEYIFPTNMSPILPVSPVTTTMNYTNQFDSQTNSIITESSASRRCVPKKNIFFLKVHKCASTTISNVVVRFGIKHNLTFALPKREDGHIGWPRPFVPGMILPYTKKPNILAHHIVFNETAVREVMPSDTFHLATIREPYGQFKSTFSYFYPDPLIQLNLTAKTLENRLIQFLQEPERYEMPVKRWYKAPDENTWKYYGELSMTHNFMSREYGYDSTVRDDSPEHMHSFAKRIDLIFDLVLVKEYPAESMVLLRRTLCWDFSDVVTVPLNKGTGKVQPWDGILRERYSRWSKMDYILYNRLNQTFWAKIRNQPKDFYKEVELLISVNKNIAQYCSRAMHFNEILHIPSSEFNEPFQVTHQLCNLFEIGPHDVTQFLIRNQYGWKKQLHYRYKYRVKDTIDY